MLLRDYQIAAVESIGSYFATNHGNPVVAMPTGTGKSLVIAGLMRYVFQWPGQKVLIATHVKELVKQNHAKLMAMWPGAPAGINSEGLGKRDTQQRIIFGGIKSMLPHAEKFGVVNILVIDECHLLSTKQTTTYMKFITRLKVANPLLKVVGLTATAYRLGHGMITEGDDRLFTDICFDLTNMAAFNWLLAEGYLATLVPKRPKTLLDVTGVHVQGGEFKQDQLQLAVDKDEITFAALTETIELAEGREHWLVFAAGVGHARHIATMLNGMGVSAIAIHSEMSDKERDDGIEAWKQGKYTAAVNNNILTTGIDFPGIDLIVMLRPTASTVLWVQMLGRGTRPMYAEGFDLWTREGRLQAIMAGPKPTGTLVLDFAGNTKRLGPINDPLIPRKKGSGGGGAAPAKCCDFCNTWNNIRATECFHCGTQFFIAPKIKDTADTKPLIKMDDPVMETFAVDQITYAKHEKRNGTGVPSLKVTYYCGFNSFHEWVPIEAVGSARGIAQRWWNARKGSRYSENPFPETVDEALSQVNELPTATHIRVWTNDKYPRVMAHCFDGTDFGRLDKPAENVVKVQAPAPVVKTSWKGKTFDDMDDDIPF